MKKGLVAILVVAAVVLGIFFWFQSTYNGMVKMDEGVQAAWSQVENVYQRRADLIPNLVATVKVTSEVSTPVRLVSFITVMNWVSEEL